MTQMMTVTIEGFLGKAFNRTDRQNAGIDIALTQNGEWRTEEREVPIPGLVAMPEEERPTEIVESLRPPREYARFTVIEYIRTTDDRGRDVTKPEYNRCICWAPERIRNLHTLEQGDNVRITARVGTYNGRTQFEVQDLQILGFNRRHAVPAYDYDPATGEVVATEYRRDWEIAQRCGEYDPVPRRPGQCLI